MSYLTDFIEDAKRGNTNERAAALILEHGHASGQHYQRWLLDQTLRIIAGEGYSYMVTLWQAETGREWDTGIAP